MLRRLLSTLLLVFIASFAAIAQSGQGQLKGKVIDESTGDPIPFANVVVKLNGVFQVGGTTDMDGVFLIKPISPGTYSVEASTVGMQTAIVSGVGIRSDKTSFLDIKLKTKSEMLEEFVVTEYKVPLFEKDQTVISTTVTKDDLVHMPTRGAAGIAATVGGVYASDDGTGGLNMRGARSDANYYFIDGIKVRGSSNVPQQGVEEISVITGGIPAQYGDVTGGVIAITTRGPSANYFGSMEYVTSGYKIGDEVYGLDKYGYNLLEASVSGPLLMKKDTNGEKTNNPLVGFFLSGNLNSYADPRPTATGTWQIKEEALEELTANPLVRATDGESGTYQSAEYLRLNSFEKVNTRSNVENNGFVLNGKLDFATGKNTNLTFGGSFDWSQYNDFQYTYSLLNYDDYPQVTENTWRVFGRFTQRFNNKTQSEEEKSSSLIKNAYYSVQVDYNQNNYVRQDESHKDNLFAYGYYGQFTRYQDRDYEVNYDTVYGADGQQIYVGYIREQTTFQDTLIGFTPSSLNPEAAQYTSSYFDLFGWEGYDENGNPIYDSELASEDVDGDGTITDDEVNYYLRSFENIQSNGGLLNGDLAYTPNYVYSIWNNQAMVFNSYQTYNTSQFRVSATGSADIMNHAISLGFEYEQRVDRGYAANPVGLWRIGNQLTNNHISNLDSVGTMYFYSTLPTVNYERQNSSPLEYSGEINEDNQAFFDYNIRKSLGLDPNGTDFIDFQNLTPDQLEIDYFSANELLNSGSELVYYFGYDPYGNKTNDNPTIDDFFNETDEYGNYTRPIGAFRPTYVAGYIQDKFTFEDLVFNIGVRVDRYDANQSVLKDKYVLFPTVKAGESEVQDIAIGMGDYTIPGNIGDDYVVYVDNVENPTEIVGYRNEGTWYNASGEEITDGSSLEGANGIAPLLVDKTNTNPQNDLSSESFEDYTPQINFMPRISFSFPISEDATFFAHYDVLTKRPTVGSSLYNYSRLNVLDYYFINQRTSSTILANPDLKPEKTIDYSLGFKQKISNSSSISIEAFYREMRDQIQVVSVTNAYPKTYLSYDNVDFGTTKGLIFSYDLRKAGNSPLSLRASYTLQFAEGTGSSSSSATNLIRAGLQNLRNTTALNYDQRHTFVATIDYRYGDKQGPRIKDKPILENAGVNFQFNLGSGTPYSKQLEPTGTSLISGGGTALLDGTINGSRLPWQFRIDMRLDKNFALKVGKKDKALDLNVYLQMLNVLNSLNVVDVYRATGEADDDGYLGDPTAQATIETSLDPQSYAELYTMSMQDYRYYALPRRTRIGFILSF